MGGEQQLEESRQGAVKNTPARDVETGFKAQPQPPMEFYRETVQHFCPSVHDVQL